MKYIFILNLYGDISISKSFQSQPQFFLARLKEDSSLQQLISTRNLSALGKSIKSCGKIRERIQFADLEVEGCREE
jgi:hypothetical protein